MFTFFRSNGPKPRKAEPEPEPESESALQLHSQPQTEPQPPTDPQKPTKSTQETPSTTTTVKPSSDPLPSLWTPQTNKKLFFGGLLFLTFSLLTTRRALHRRYRSSIPPFYTSSVYHKPAVNGAGEAFEALNLATINVLSFAMMASGGVLWAMGINSLEDMRGYVRKGAISPKEAGRGLSEVDREMEREVEEWIGNFLGKKVRLVEDKVVGEGEEERKGKGKGEE